MPLELVDKQYEERMANNELDCNDGKGDSSACHHVAEFYALVHDNHVKASKLYQQNCEVKGYAPSCFNLAKLYLSGKGVEQDDGKALNFFDISCRKNHLSACYHQGAIEFLKAKEIISSTSPKPNASNSSMMNPLLSKPLGLLEQTCYKGESESCHFSACYYMDKNNPNRQPVKARDLFQQSCDANHGTSCFNLAVLYKHGDVGIQPNEDKFNEYKKRTEDLLQQYGNLNGVKIA